VILAVRTEIVSAATVAKVTGAKAAARDRLQLAGSGCTRPSAVWRATANGRFQARRSEPREPGVTAFQGFQIAGVAVVDQFLDLARPLASLPAAIEQGHLVTASERVAHMMRPCETRAAQDQDAQLLHGAAGAVCREREAWRQGETRNGECR